MSKIHNVSVLGAGSWGTALVKILQDNKEVKNIHWWLHKKSTLDHLLNHGNNPDYLTEVKLDTRKITFHLDLETCIKSSDHILVVIPSAFIEQNLGVLNPTHWKDKVIFSAVKGVIPSTKQVITDYLEEKFKLSENQIGVVSGPSHAEEIAKEKLTYLTSACKDANEAELMAHFLNNPYLTANTSADVVGIEYAAVLKNIYAIASGIFKGLNYGDNFQAVLIAASLREMKMILRDKGVYHDAMTTPPYLGDLLVTCYSEHSRNRRLGLMLGEGLNVEQALTKMNMVAEGYYGTQSIGEWIGTSLDEYPILKFVHQAIKGDGILPPKNIRNLF